MLCYTTVTGALNISHLGSCCPLAYSSRVSYVKKRQVWKSQSETDWPHLEITSDFSTEKNRSIHILTSTCWQEISLSNTVELTTAIPQKQKICRFKCRVLPVFENSRGSIFCLHAANLVARHDRVALFSHMCPFQFDSQQTSLKTKPPNHGASWDLLHVGRQWNLWNFQKLAKNDVSSGRSFASVEWQQSVQWCLKKKFLVNMWMLKWECCDFFLWRNLALFPGGVNQFLIRTFTPISSLCMILYYYRSMDSNCPSD